MGRYRKREQGLTFISLVIVLGIIGFFTLLVLKIGPIYMNHSKVLNALYSLEQTGQVEKKSKNEIRLILAKRFNLNYVDHIDLDDIKISKAGGYLKVRIYYEVVEPIVGNLSVLVEFDDVIEVSGT